MYTKYSIVCEPTMETITARLPDKMIKILNTLVKEEMVDRSELIRRILEIGLREFLIRRALIAYQERKVSLWRAADMAGVTLREMIEAANQALIPISYDLDDLERDLAIVKKQNSRE